MRLPPRLIRDRRMLLTAYWTVQTLVAYFLALLFSAILFGGSLRSWWEWAIPFIIAAGFVAMQVLLLLPIRRPKASGGGIPIIASLLVGGVLVACMSAALAMAVGHTLDEYGFYPFGEFDARLVAIVMAGSWLIATPLLLVFCAKGRNDHVVTRMAAALFIGTIIEAAAIIPLDALIRRREDCVCGTGTFFGLALCGSLGIFLFGPAMLVPLFLRHRKRWYGRRCDVCGYDITGLRGVDRCPECGAGWRRVRHAPTPDVPTGD